MVFLRNHKGITLTLIPIILLLGGTLGYHILEGYSFGDGLYMTIITITTVGFGEVHPLTDSGKLFTSILILLGFGSIAFLAHELGDVLVNRLMSSKSEIKKMKKQILRLNSHYIICGFGRVGAAAVKKFKEAGVDFVVIEQNQDAINYLKENQILYLEGNATDDDVLSAANVKSAAGLLAILPSDPDNLFIALTVREMNPTIHIIARAENPASEKKLIQAGTDSVVSPYTSAGKNIANDMLIASGLLNKTREVISQSRNHPQWIAVKDGSSMVGESVSHLTKEMNRTIFGIRRGSKDILAPGDDVVLKINDQILVVDERLESREDVSVSREKQKILIVDDNLVILKLYARLLHRAGFIPLVAEDGQHALETIRTEHPAAAILDYMLPVKSGLEICREIRQDQKLDDVKLIIFTGEEEQGIRKKALAAGADEVVIKSPEVSRLVDLVIDMLHNPGD